MLSCFSCSPVICECSWKETHIEKKKFANFEHSFRNDIFNPRNYLNNVEEVIEKEYRKMRESLSRILMMAKKLLRRTLKTEKRR